MYTVGYGERLSVSNIHSIERGRLKQGSLGVRQLTFFVIAAAAPLTILVGFTPLALIYGGPITATGFVVAGCTYLLFSVIFTAMSRYVVNSGAFYSYIHAGLGIEPAAAAAVVAYLAYAMCQIGFCSVAGLFVASALTEFLGMHMPWYLCAAVLALLSGMLSYRRVNVGARVMGVLMLLEIGIMLWLAICILRVGGHEGLSNSGSLSLTGMLSPRFGAAYACALLAFVGFEQTAIYSEEAKDPTRTVMIATYVAVIFLTVFYTVMFWAFYMGIGPSRLATVLAGDVSRLVFDLAAGYIGKSLTQLLELLVITSFFAGVMALQNASTRYLFSVARDGLLPPALARVSPTTGVPSVATVSQTVLTVIAILMFAATGADPYTQILVWTNTPPLIAVLVLQAATAAAGFCFFGRMGEQPRAVGIGTRVVAPVAAILVLTGSLGTILANFGLLTGKGFWGNFAILSPLIVGGLAGYLRGVVLRRRKCLEIA
ncbi:APC family permease [Burkholderia stabilis]|uniref:APC family permease n=1 Tax=Burkholderia stabilis TaxID=95485 RepID=A0A4Q2A6M7_9BURK|nr:APC family permease [Burkholderia stabilis]